MCSEIVVWAICIAGLGWLIFKIAEIVSDWAGPQRHDRRPALLSSAREHFDCSTAPFADRAHGLIVPAQPRTRVDATVEFFIWIRRNPLKSPESAKGIQGNPSFFSWNCLDLLGFIWCSAQPMTAA